MATAAGGACITSCPPSVLQRADPQSTPAIASGCVSGARPTPEETSTDASCGRRSSSSTRLGVMTKPSGAGDPPVGVVEGRVRADLSAGGEPPEHAGARVGGQRLGDAPPAGLDAALGLQVAAGVGGAPGVDRPGDEDPVQPVAARLEAPPSRASVNDDESKVGHAAVATSLIVAVARGQSESEGATRRSTTVPTAVSVTRAVAPRGRPGSLRQPLAFATQATRASPREIGLPPTGACSVSAPRRARQAQKRGDEAEQQREGTHGSFRASRASREKGREGSMDLGGAVGRKLPGSIAAADGSHHNPASFGAEVDAPLLEGEAHPGAVGADAPVGVGLRAESERRLDGGLEVDAPVSQQGELLGAPLR